MHSRGEWLGCWQCGQELLALLHLKPDVRWEDPRIYFTCVHSVLLVWSKAYRPPILVCLYLHITFSSPPIHCIPSSSFSCSLMFPDLFQHKFAYCFSLELSSPGCCKVWVSLFKFEHRLLSLITFLSNFPCPLITLWHVILRNQKTSDIRKSVFLHLA